MLNILENFLHSCSWTLICAIYIFYQTAAWSIILSLSLGSLSLPGSHTSTICDFLKQHTFNTKEILMFQNFIFDLI